MSKPKANEAPVAFLQWPKAYTYSQFQDHHSFRLLAILPTRRYLSGSDQSSGPILEVRLRKFSFHNDVKYKCLSYTWGAPTSTHTILVNGNVLQVTANLYLALRTLQRTGDRSFFWIDAICINQNDLEERAQQVQHMPTIYSGAEEVIAFLGESAHNSHDVPRFMAHIIDGVEKWTAERRLDSKTPIFHPNARLEQFKIPDNEYTAYGIAPPRDISWASIKVFLTRPWFTRVWIIQEVVLARKLTFICGDWYAPGEFIFYFIALALLHVLPIGTSSPHAATTGLHQLRMMNSIIADGFEKGEGRSRFGNSKLKLLNLIQFSRHQSATNPRDNIFALLGISKEYGLDDVQPNYVETVADTYRRFASYVIGIGDGTSLLEAIEYSQTDLNLPSWIPDWRTRKQMYRSLTPVRLFTAQEDNSPRAGGFGSNMRIEPCGKRLVVRAYVIDTVESLGFADFRVKFLQNDSNIFQHGIDDYNHQEGMEDLAGCLAEVAQFLHARETYPTNEVKSDVVWRTIMCNQEFGTDNEAPDKYRDLFNAMMTAVRSLPDVLSSALANVDLISQTCPSFSDDKAVENELTPREIGKLHEQAALFLTMASIQSEGRRRFLTKKGYVGQIPKAGRRGDMIIIISGARIPLLVRPTGDGYSLVGQCYLHGFMKGEVLSMVSNKAQDVILV